MEDDKESRTYHFIVKLLALYLPTDKDKLKKKLLQDAHWEDESIDTDPFESTCAEYVGYFSIAKGKIIAHTEEIKNAICIGDMLFAKWLDRPGVVAYNLETGSYEIQYNRELTKEEVKLILSAYHIVDVAYCISIDKCRM